MRKSLFICTLFSIQIGCVPPETNNFYQNADRSISDIDHAEGTLACVLTTIEARVCDGRDRENRTTECVDGRAVCEDPPRSENDSVFNCNYYTFYQTRQFEGTCEEFEALQQGRIECLTNGDCLADWEVCQEQSCIPTRMVRCQDVCSRIQECVEGIGFFDVNQCLSDCELTPTSLINQASQESRLCMLREVCPPPERNCGGQCRDRQFESYMESLDLCHGSDSSFIPEPADAFVDDESEDTMLDANAMDMTMAVPDSDPVLDVTVPMPDSGLAFDALFEAFDAAF